MKAIKVMGIVNERQLALDFSLTIDKNESQKYRNSFKKNPEILRSLIILCLKSVELLKIKNLALLF